MNYSKQHYLCPRCGGTAQYNYNSQTDEWHGLCYKCGQYESYQYKRDTRGRIIFDEYQEPIPIHTINEGFGIIKIVYKADNAVRLTPLPHKFDEQIKQEFYSIIEDENIDKDACALVYWNDKTSTIDVEYGDMPEGGFIR